MEKLTSVWWWLFGQYFPEVLSLWNVQGWRERERIRVIPGDRLQIHSYFFFLSIGYWYCFLGPWDGRSLLISLWQDISSAHFLQHCRLGAGCMKSWRVWEGQVMISGHWNTSAYISVCSDFKEIANVKNMKWFKQKRRGFSCKDFRPALTGIFFFFFSFSICAWCYCSSANTSMSISETIPLVMQVAAENICF